MRARRLPILVLIPLVLLGLALAGRSNTTLTAAGGRIDASGLMPLASPPAAVSSAFYCAGGVATPGAGSDTTVVVANPNATAAAVDVTVYPAALASDPTGVQAVAGLRPVTKTVTVGPRSRADVHLAGIQPSPFAAALVETSDPDIAVDRRVDGATGSASAPCASAPSSTWYFPTGTTTRDARELLALFNPFPLDAVVDITFQTSDGLRSPPELTSLPVPGGQLRIVDVSAAVPRLEQLAAFVTSRSGRIVADRMQGFDGSDPNHPAGIASTAGAPAPAKIWTFAEGLVNDATNDRYTLQNPNDAPANVELDVVLDTPATNGSVDPITAVVPAHGYAQVSMHDETRVPHDVGHSVTARVTNGVPIVVERVITAVPPAPRRGYTPSLGSPLVASQWVVPDGRAVAGTVAEFLVIVNPSPDTIAHVDIGALAQGQLLAIDGLQNVEVAAGGRLSIDLGQHVNREDLPIIVTADAPIVVERGLYAANANGISVSTGVPLTETAAVPKVKAASTTSTTAVTFPQSS